MKQFYFFLICLLSAGATQAADYQILPGDGAGTREGTVATATREKAVTSVVKAGTVQFQFNNVAPSKMHKDSVLIIFDRYNHTGAGIIYQVYTADDDHCITIPEVPAGKYYVTIQCLGMHHDRVEKLVSIKSKKNEKVRINLEDSEAFSKDKVVIPAYRPDFANLAVLKSK